ncbi:hypothetical protein BDZ88DRAFT_507235 [Geranomyces variabilis]|nr:hypothetical protein BDZ88DRAFT_507235 [Geranomyces variabilis]KAJ3133335.1 hypothetical protein HDU90_006284 [Geranomyces variabilis]
MTRFTNAATATVTVATNDAAAEAVPPIHAVILAHEGPAIERISLSRAAETEVVDVQLGRWAAVAPAHPMEAPVRADAAIPTATNTDAQSDAVNRLLLQIV